MTMPLSPRQRYQHDLQHSGFTPDAAQACAVDALQDLHDRLLAHPPVKRFASRRLQWPPVRGLYLWGEVGRGKTYLMDAFYESLPFSRKMRTHFHRFMLEVHERRTRFLEEQDPVALIAEDFAARTRVLCFDEFFVSDIADAMILGRLTEVLFRAGVTLVATSNVAPDELYRDGLQRERFLPAIARINTHCDVIHLDSQTDYRLRALTAAPLYYHPGDESAEAALDVWFARLAPDTGRRDAGLTVHGRTIRTIRLADGIAWFDFAELCETARSAADYIEIARTHHSVIVSGVPQLDAARDDAARRFVHLVDEFYDRGVKLILAAAVPHDALYSGDRLQFEYRRAQSRLTEMQSQEYLARPHLP